MVTLASPHQRSPAHLQPALARFYRRLRSHPAPAVPVISIAGGAADVQVCKQTLRRIATVLLVVLSCLWYCHSQLSLLSHRYSSR